MVFAEPNKLELHLPSAFVQIWLFLAQLLTLSKFTQGNGQYFSLSYTPNIVDVLHRFILFFSACGKSSIFVLMQPLKKYYHLSPQDAFVVAGCRSTKDACDKYESHNVSFASWSIVLVSGRWQVLMLFGDFILYTRHAMNVLFSHYDYWWIVKVLEGKLIRGDK